jgi:uncharacterized protein
MIVVSNTSPLSNLAIIGQLSLLQQIYSKVIIPPAVYRELTNVNSIGAEITTLLTTGWIETQSVSERALVETLQSELDEGEAEAIALAIELKADRLLIDERLGRSVATRYKLKITGLLGILTAAKVSRLIPSVKPVLDNLIEQAGFRVSRELYARTLQGLEE